MAKTAEESKTIQIIDMTDCREEDFRSWQEAVLHWKGSGERFWIADETGHKAAAKQNHLAGFIDGYIWYGLTGLATGVIFKYGPRIVRGLTKLFTK